MDLIAFLTQVVVISLSGVMAPGPVSAVTVGMGARNRHAGALVAVGHVIVEFPLMVLIIVGVGGLFTIPAVRVGIGLAGGVMLIVMGGGMLRKAGKPTGPASEPSRRGPVLTGILLSAGNPYFLLWWATVGLAIASRAVRLGLLAFGLFAILHWLCDLIWLEALSWTSHRGSRLLGGRSERIVVAICGALLLFFGCMFVFNGGKDLMSMVANTVEFLLVFLEHQPRMLLESPYISSGFPDWRVPIGE